MESLLIAPDSEGLLAGYSPSSTGSPGKGSDPLLLSSILEGSGSSISIAKSMPMCTGLLCTAVVAVSCTCVDALARDGGGVKTGVGAFASIGVLGIVADAGNGESAKARSTRSGVGPELLLVDAKSGV